MWLLWRRRRLLRLAAVLLTVILTLLELVVVLLHLIVVLLLLLLVLLLELRVLIGVGGTLLCRCLLRWRLLLLAECFLESLHERRERI